MIDLIAEISNYLIRIVLKNFKVQILSGGTAAFVLHVVFSLLNTMYVPYAAVYYVDRVHLMCSINAACHHLTMSDYLTSEIIVMGLGVILHCPFWFFVLLLLDIKKSGGNFSDFFKYFLVSIQIICPIRCLIIFSIHKFAFILIEKWWFNW